MIMITATWCMPCKKFKEDILQNNLDVEILDVEDPEAQEYIQQYNVRSVPTFISTINKRVYNNINLSELKYIIEMEKK